MRHVTPFFAPIFAIVLLYSLSARADMFMYTDENGVVVFTDNPDFKKIDYRLYRALKSDSMKSDYRGIIERTSEKHGVDPMLVHAVIGAESGFNESAVSSKGAMGLMQLMPTTAAQMGVYNPYEPEQNIDAGVRYLRHLIDRFGGDLRLAIAAYNAGPGSVEKYGDVPPIPETKRFVEKVFSRYKGKKLSKSAGSRNTIYRVVLDDGTIFYTNSKELLKSASRL